MHNCRHAHTTLMLKYNVPAKATLQRMGHLSIGLDLYSHVLGDMEAEAASKVDEGIFKKIG